MTLIITHPACLLHEPNDGHPECPERLEVINNMIAGPEFDAVSVEMAEMATEKDLLRAHSAQHLEDVFSAIPNWGLNFIDPDTAVCKQSREAALYAAGAAVMAVDKVMSDEAENVFCLTRPPGHHAFRTGAGGFCLFNNIAIGALTAIEKYNLSRVAIIDFDVHHGNGTQNIMWDRPDIFFASIHQWPLYVTSGTSEEKGAHNNILNVPVPAGTDGKDFRKQFVEKIMPRLKEFKAEMIFVSAGFDAHEKDPLGGLELAEDDFAFMMQELVIAARDACQGRLVAVLEGGYNTHALANSVAACLRVMMK